MGGVFYKGGEGLSHLVPLVAEGNVGRVGVGVGPLALASCTCTRFHNNTLTRKWQHMRLRVDLMQIVAVAQKQP